MFDNGASAALAALLEADLSVADHAELATVSSAAGRLKIFAEHVLVQVNRRTRELAEHGDRSSEHVLSDEARLSGRDRRATNDRDRICSELPEFEDALANGDCTGGHLDALAHHTRDLTDAEKSDVASVVEDLVADAANSSVGVFDKSTRELVDKIREMHRPDSDVERLDRQRTASEVCRWTDRDTGMKLTKLALDPIRDASLWNAINAELHTIRRDPANKQRPFTELQIDAVMAAIDHQPRASTDPGRRVERVPEVVVHVDAATLCHGRHDHTVCETIDGEPIPAATVQRLCCEAILQAVVVAPDGTVDRICREQRTANRAQRRMLAAMYPTCAHPNCEVGFSQCRIHHVEWYTNGGETILANLLPLCETHHHLVHEGRWSLTINQQRHVTWIKPNGQTWRTDTGPPRTTKRRPTEPEQHRSPKPSGHPELDLAS